MRHADEPGITEVVEVAADAAAVWALVTDVDLPARFSDEFRGGSWIDPGPALGARFRGRNELPGMGTWETTSTVTEFEPLRTFGWAVEDPDRPAARWRFDLEPIATGVRLRYSARMGSGPSGLTALIAADPDAEEQLVATRLEMWRRNLVATLEGIKALAEAAG